MANGNGSKIFSAVAASLALAAIGWGYTNARSQGQQETQIESNRKAIESRSDAVQDIPVIANKVENIEEKIDEIKTANDTAHAAIVSQMKEDKKDILRAIERK